MKKFIVLFVIFVVMFLCILGNFSVESNSNTHEIRPTNTRAPQIKKKAAYIQIDNITYLFDKGVQ